jgi:hypothetical protein
MRFAVFADQPRGVATHVHRWTKEIFEFLAAIGVLNRDLLLYQALQKSAARLAIGPSLRVEALQEAVGH